MAAVASGRRALYLVPEIGLTPLLARRMRSRFGEVLALLHSGLSDGERYDEWRRIRDGKVDDACAVVESALTSMQPQHRTEILLARADDVVVAVPEGRRALPAVTRLRDFITGCRSTEPQLRSTT